VYVFIAVITRRINGYKRHITEKKSGILERVSALHKPAVITATISASSIACDTNLSSADADPYKIHVR
jgi:hypothetical protein